MNLDISKIQILNPSQSSVLSGRDAARALDGILTFYSLGCAETTDQHNKQWWKAEFEKIRYVTSIRILPRYDCCRERYTHVTVDTSLDGNTWTLCAHLGGSLKTAAIDSWVDAKRPENTRAKYVKIILHDKLNFMLCEVQALGYKPSTLHNVLEFHQCIRYKGSSQKIELIYI